MRRVTSQLLGLAAAVFAVGLVSSSAHAAVTIANFEDGTFNGFGTSPSSGSPTPGTFVAPTSGEIITPAAGGDLTKVLHLTASGYNGGLAGGATLGLDLKAAGFTAAFLANDILSFNWEVVPSATPTGYSQIYNVVLNSPAGYTSVGGSGSGSSQEIAGSVNNRNPPYTGQLNTLSINYSAYKALLAGNTNPSYLQLIITTNNGGGAPPDFYFDNFSLSTVPEPTSLAAVAVGGVTLIKRRRRA